MRITFDRVLLLMRSVLDWRFVLLVGGVGCTSQLVSTFSFCLSCVSKNKLLFVSLEDVLR